jgi:hypothetical protein
MASSLVQVAAWPQASHLIFSAPPWANIRLRFWNIMGGPHVLRGPRSVPRCFVFHASTVWGLGAVPIDTHDPDGIARAL